MPAKPAWLLRTPEILHDLQSLTVPVVDRCMFERLFCVRRRRAITLMQEFGAPVNQDVRFFLSAWP